MKCLMIYMVLFISASVANALTVTVSNVVVAYQTDAQRQAYTGRAGELVRNTDLNSITMFDGVTQGGRQLLAGGDYTYIVRTTTNAVQNFVSLTNTIAVASAQQSLYQEADDLTYGPVVLLEPGTYDFGTNYFDCGNWIQLQALSDQGPVRRLDSALTFGKQLGMPSVKFTGTASPFIRMRQYSGAKGIEFDGVARLDPLCNVINCYFVSNMYEQVMSGSYTGCRFDGTICATSGFKGGSFVDCIFTSGSAGSLSYIGESGVAVGRLINCEIDGADFFDSPASGYTEIRNSKINSSGIFATGGFGSAINVFDTDFYGADSTWFSGAFGYSATKFCRCTGIDTNVAGTAATFIGCYDQTGTAIP